VIKALASYHIRDSAPRYRATLALALDSDPGPVPASHDVDPLVVGAWSDFCGISPVTQEPRHKFLENPTGHLVNVIHAQDLEPGLFSPVNTLPNVPGHCYEC